MNTDKNRRKDTRFTKLFCCFKSSSLKNSMNDINDEMYDDGRDGKKNVRINSRKNDRKDECCVNNNSSFELIEENNKRNEIQFLTVQDKMDSPPSFVASSLIHVWNDSIQLKDSDLTSKNDNSKSNESINSCCTTDDEGFLGGLSLNSHEALNHASFFFKE
uniref:Ovate family protein n=1 Tax=Parastrongyloides trichosuri TaxID=131310 RepID=A0A0N4Z1M4_PARTI